MAAGLLARLSSRLAELKLAPVTGGRFEVEVGDERVFDNHVAHRLPSPDEAVELVAAKL